MGGLEATKRIRVLNEDCARIPIIALTAHAVKGVKEECLEVGMTDYVTKPIDYAELFAAIEKTMGIESPFA